MSWWEVPTILRQGGYWLVPPASLASDADELEALRAMIKHLRGDSSSLCWGSRPDTEFNKLGDDGVQDEEAEVKWDGAWQWGQRVVMRSRDIVGKAVAGYLGLSRQFEFEEFTSIERRNQDLEALATLLEGRVGAKLGGK